MFISSLHLTTQSADSSDTSLGPHNKSDSHVTSSLSVLSKPYDREENETGRHTALPTVFRDRIHSDYGEGRREAKFTASGGV